MQYFCCRDERRGKAKMMRGGSRDDVEHCVWASDTETQKAIEITILANPSQAQWRCLFFPVGQTVHSLLRPSPALPRVSVRTADLQPEEPGQRLECFISLYGCSIADAVWSTMSIWTGCSQHVGHGIPRRLAIDADVIWWPGAQLCRSARIITS